MNLYHISQDINDDYDTYSDAVVAALNDEDARNMPVGYGTTWVAPKDVKVEFLGIAANGIEAGVICASFHAS